MMFCVTDGRSTGGERHGDERDGEGLRCLHTEAGRYQTGLL